MATKTINRPAPTVNAVAQDNVAADSNATISTPAAGTSRNLIEEQLASVGQRAVAKHELLVEARKELETANEFYAKGVGEADKAEEYAVRAGRRLYQARTTGLMAPDEVSALLGSVFGFKLKQNGEQSKTPEGRGEDIRKRVVRAHAAKEFVETGEGGTFFEGLEPSDIQPMLTELDNGTRTIWSVYQTLTDMKAANRDPVKPAFSERAIMAIASELNKEGSGEQFRANPALIAAYAELVQIVNMIATID